jgi:hypothetical protein
MWLLVIAGVVAAAMYVRLVGLLTNALRLRVAGLPVGQALFVISVTTRPCYGTIIQRPRSISPCPGKRRG